jgi:Fe-S cluster assembly protein SufD
MSAVSGVERESFRVLLEKFRAEAVTHDPLEQMRQKAWNHFLQLGLPSKNNEVYQYIKLRHLFAQPYQMANQPRVLQSVEIASYIYPECSHSCIVFVNGDYSPSLSCIDALPSKVDISSLQEATHTYGTFLNNQWSKTIKEETDSFASLNGALHRQGVFVYIPAKTVIEVPIQFLHIIDSPEQELQLLMPRIQVFVGAQAEVKCIATQKQLYATEYLVNQVTEFVIEEAAHVHYTQVLCDEHPKSWHLDAFRASLKKESRLETVCITKGSATVRTDYRINLIGERAEALLNGVWTLSHTQEAHSHVYIDHQVPFCRSFQLFKGVLRGFSRSSFEGKIMVRQAAQKTEAFQLNNNILLDDHVHADSKPNLEIFADDVKASHGTTIGQLDPEQLFYMQTRNFSRNEAQTLLVKSFCYEILEKIQIASCKIALENSLLTYLANSTDE